MDGEFIYIFYSYLFGFFSLTAMNTNHNKGCHQKYNFCFLLHSNTFTSNMYILDQNSKLPPHTVSVAYLYYIFLLLICGYCTLTLKTGGLWNLLESYPDRTQYVESSHKWTQIIFNIYYSKLGIWIFSQPTIYVKSQYKFYDVLLI